MDKNEAVRVYRRNHKLKRGLFSVKSMRNLVKKFKETGCTCDRTRFGRPRVPFEVVTEVHNAMTISPLHTAKSVSHNLNVSKTTVLKILRSILRMFPD